MRLTRLIIGAAVVLAALWVLVGEQLAGASADAVVNGRLVTLRAPVAGTLALQARALGSGVAAGEEVGSVTDPLVDRVRLDDLTLENAYAVAAATRAAAELAAAQAALPPLEARTEAFRAGRATELAARLDEARARLEALGGAEAAPPPAPATAEGGEDDDLSAMLDEGQSGAGPDAGLSGDVPAIALSYARERVAVLEAELAAAEGESFLGDGYNDAPWSEQTAEALRRTIADRTAARDEARARAQALDTRLAAARLSVSRAGGGPLASPVNGQVWELRAADGERVQRGDPVMILLDCDTLLVTLSVTESIYNRLAIGDAARFRLSGDGRDFPATVTRLGGAGAATLYRSLAVAPSQEHLDRFDVALLVPGLAGADGLACPVGRTGRAFFERRPLDWLRGL